MLKYLSAAASPSLRLYPAFRWGVVVAAAASVAHAQPGATPPGSAWTKDCEPARCLLSVVIPHGEKPPLNELYLGVSVDRSDGSFNLLGILLPPDAEQGETLVVGFADTKTGADGQPHVEETPDSKYVFRVSDCDKQSCKVALLKSYPDAKGRVTSEELRTFFMKDNLMYLYYRQHGETRRAMVALYPFRDLYKSVVAAK